MKLPQSKPKLPAGSIQIDKILLKSDISNKELDLQVDVIELSVFEAISQPFVTAELYIADALALTSIMPIVGQETVTITFKTPDDSILKSVDVTLRVVSVEHFRRINQRTASYLIHLASEEYFNDLNTRIMKSYREKPISDMVQDIATYFLKSSKTLDIEATDGNRTIVIPNMHPTRALQFLAKEAKSQQHEPSNYVFYENLDKLRFVTLDSLIKERAYDSYYATEKDWSKDSAQSLRDTVTGSSRGGTSTKPFELTKITHFQFVNLFSIDKTMAMGGFENKALVIDPIYSLFETKTYEYFEDHSKLAHTTDGQAGKVIIESNHIQKDNESLLNYYMTNTNGSGIDTDQKPDFYHLMRASTALLDNIVVNITVPGDSDRRAGDVIKIEFPEYGGTDDVKNEINRFISGEYLVLSVRHLYTTKSGYSCVMQCAKNCYQRDVDAEQS